MQVSSPDLHLAVLLGDVETARVLLAQPESGAVDAPCKGGFRPVHLAARFPLGARVLPLLLAHGADVGAPDPFGSTALHLAASAREAAACAALLDSGRYLGAAGKLLLEARDSDTFTPLADAVHDANEGQARSTGHSKR